MTVFLEDPSWDGGYIGLLARWPGGEMGGYLSVTDAKILGGLAHVWAVSSRAFSWPL